MWVSGSDNVRRPDGIMRCQPVLDCCGCQGNLAHSCLRTVPAPYVGWRPRLAPPTGCTLWLEDLSSAMRRTPADWFLTPHTETRTPFSVLMYLLTFPALPYSRPLLVQRCGWRTLRIAPWWSTALESASSSKPRPQLQPAATPSAGRSSPHRPASLQPRQPQRTPRLLRQGASGS